MAKRKDVVTLAVIAAVVGLFVLGGWWYFIGREEGPKRYTAETAKAAEEARARDAERQREAAKPGESIGDSIVREKYPRRVRAVIEDLGGTVAHQATEVAIALGSCAEVRDRFRTGGELAPPPGVTVICTSPAGLVQWKFTGK